MKKTSDYAGLLLWIMLLLSEILIFIDRPTVLGVIAIILCTLDLIVILCDKFLNCEENSEVINKEKIIRVKIKNIVHRRYTRKDET